MRQVRKSINKYFSTQKLTIPVLQELLDHHQDCMVVEIAKNPQQLFQKSVWIGYRNGGMASWLTHLLPQLPFDKFCLYMDEDRYHGSEFMPEYYAEYFSKLFHKNCVGICVEPRRFVQKRFLYTVDEVKAEDLAQEFSSPFKHKILLDLRISQSAQKDPLSEMLLSYQNCSYFNLPLNEEEVLDQVTQKIMNLPQQPEFITMCAKGYRSMIGYSFLRLLKEKMKLSYDLKVCTSTVEEIKKSLNVEKKKGILENY